MSTADDRFLHDVMCCFCVTQGPPLREHSFRVGLKLEILHPTIPCAICPGTVFRIINKYYFIATVSLTCHLLRHRPLFVLTRTLPLAAIFSIALTTSQINRVLFTYGEHCFQPNQKKFPGSGMQLIWKGIANVCEGVMPSTSATAARTTRQSVSKDVYC